MAVAIPPAQQVRTQDVRRVAEAVGFIGIGSVACSSLSGANGTYVTGAFAAAATYLTGKTVYTLTKDVLERMALPPKVKKGFAWTAALLSGALMTRFMASDLSNEAVIGAVGISALGAVAIRSVAVKVWRCVRG
jgi:hypothetical protein